MDGSNLGGGAAGVAFVAVAAGTVVGVVVWFLTAIPLLAAVLAVASAVYAGRNTYRLLE